MSGQTYLQHKVQKFRTSRKTKKVHLYSLGGSRESQRGTGSDLFLETFPVERRWISLEAQRALQEGEEDGWTGAQVGRVDRAWTDGDTVVKGPGLTGCGGEQKEGSSPLAPPGLRCPWDRNGGRPGRQAWMLRCCKEGHKGSPGREGSGGDGAGVRKLRCAG